MNPTRLLYRGSLIAALLCLAAGSAASDPPDPQSKDPATPELAQETPVADADTNESVAACPCADDFDAAIAIYEARPGTPIQQPHDVCSDSKGGLGKYGVAMRKFDALTPSDKGRTTHIHMDASRNWTLWGSRYVHCWVWVWTDSQPMTSLFRPPNRKDFSDAELAACVKMVREIAQCPN